MHPIAKLSAHPSESSLPTPPFSTHVNFEAIVQRVSLLKPENIYGECLHTRGSNITELESMLGESITLGNFDLAMEKKFHSTLMKYGMKGRWWKEHKNY